MLIRVWVDQPDPPTGRVEPDGGPPAPFFGWLGLLHVLHEIIAGRPEAAGGQLTSSR